MKKWYLVVAGLTILLAVISCGGPSGGTKAPIPQAAITEIFTLNELEAIGKFVEIKEVQDRAEGCYMMIYIKPLSQKRMGFGEAGKQAKSFTGIILKDAVKILGKYNINQDVTVWAQLPSKERGVTVLGHAEYDAKRCAFYDYEPFQRKL